MTRFIYSFDLQHRHHTFLNSNASQAREFWKNTYLDPTQSREEAYLTQMTNSFGIELIEGFRKWAKFGLSAYISYRTRNTSNPHISGSRSLRRMRQLPLRPFPTISTFPRRLLATCYGWEAVCKKIKDQYSDMRQAPIRSRRRRGRRPRPQRQRDHPIQAFRRFRENRSQCQFPEHRPALSSSELYLKSFRLEQRFRENTHLQNRRRTDNPWTKTTLRAGVENIQNLVYFNSNSLPEQYGETCRFSLPVRSNCSRLESSIGTTP